MKWCKARRIHLNLSQRDVARASKGALHQNTVSAIESGRVNPNDKERAALSDILGIPADRLLEPCVIEPVSDKQVYQMARRDEQEQ